MGWGEINFSKSVIALQRSGRHSLARHLILVCAILRGGTPCVAQ
jgi:hypothetical protein